MSGQNNRTFLNNLEMFTLMGGGINKSNIKPYNFPLPKNERKN